jgi:FHA domain/zinc-ribbon domain
LTWEASPTVFCTRCGHENPDDARFCAQCGAPLARADYQAGPDATSIFSPGALEDYAASAGDEQADEHVGAVDALPPGSALLVVKRGPNAGSRFLLDQDVTTAGRHPDSDIFLDDVTVSRRHAEFHRGSGGFTVRDVGSLNGTYVNRERVESATLANSDEVQIGKFRLVFIAGPRLDDVT